IEVNEALVDAPELVNEQPYQEGWIFRIKITDESELADLLDADAYSALLEEDE
ncbi:glycine cleavage system protein H, partial [Klebsiella pneumoniae]|nr:glycine cleavage system protein H [Klebsiella pneumoniae]